MSFLTIAVVGLGYVGLPVALAFSKKYSRVIGFDLNRSRIDELKAGHDRTNETDASSLRLRQGEALEPALSRRPDSVSEEAIGRVACPEAPR
jgi:UDP-N-acetyl-D-mannosaminuronate dehydrogenase